MCTVMRIQTRQKMKVYQITSSEDITLCMLGK